MLLAAIFAAISAALTGVVYLTLFPSLWWILPLWAALYLAVGVTYILLLLLAGVLLPLDTPTKATYRVYQWFIYRTLRWVLGILHIRYTVTGLDKLPTDRPFLWVCNHRGAFDPLVTLAALKNWSIAFIAKPGVFKIPVIGAIMRCKSYNAPMCYATHLLSAHQSRERPCGSNHHQAGRRSHQRKAGYLGGYLSRGHPQ